MNDPDDEALVRSAQRFVNLAEKAKLFRGVAALCTLALRLFEECTKSATENGDGKRAGIPSDVTMHNAEQAFEDAQTALRLLRDDPEHTLLSPSPSPSCERAAKTQNARARKRKQHSINKAPVENLNSELYSPLPPPTHKPRRFRGLPGPCHHVANVEVQERRLESLQAHGQFQHDKAHVQHGQGQGSEDVQRHEAQQEQVHGHGQVWGLPIGASLIAQTDPYFLFAEDGCI